MRGISIKTPNVPTRLVLSYILDWILIIIVAVIGQILSEATPNQNPFSLTDQNISYPYKSDETVPNNVQVLITLVIPALIIAFVTLFLVPGSAISKNAPRSVKWRYKIWEWNAGWMGLAVALASAYTATQALKTLIGKPRPDMLARCKPDLSQIAKYAVSGLGQQLDGAPIIVSWEICQTKSHTLRISGFSSFPSGHSSSAFAGLTYLALWLCSKLSIAFPRLAHYPTNPDTEDERDIRFDTESGRHRSLSLRNNGAAPPVYTLIIAVLPMAVACFVAGSRWFDHRHHGFDILFGSAMGAMFAWVGFRLYNLPIGRGAGWSWGTRHSRRAFYKGIGIPSHNGDDNWAVQHNAENGILM